VIKFYSKSDNYQKLSTNSENQQKMIFISLTTQLSNLTNYLWMVVSKIHKAKVKNRI